MIKLELKRFFSSPKYYLPVMGLLITYFYRVFRLWGWLRRSVESPSQINMTFLHVPAEQSTLLFCFFLFFTYFWGREAERVNFSETLQSFSNGRTKRVLHVTLIPFLILSLICIITLVFSVFWGLRLNYTKGSFTLYLFRYLLWYILSTPSVGILFGGAFALTLAEDIAYPTQMVMALLVTGTGQSVFAHLLRNSQRFRIAKALSFFHLYPIGVQAAPVSNALYPLLPSQMAKIGAFMTLCVSVILFYIFRKPFKRIVLAGVLFVIFVFFVFNGQQTLSTPPFDRQTRFADEKYYSTYTQINQKSNYQLREISADIHFSNNLEADVQCVIENLDSGLHALTLYHGFEVHSVKLDGSEIRFSQEQDYIFFKLDAPRKRAIVELTYSGSHPLYYANAQTVFLPAYIPWLPMPGALPVYDVEYQHYRINRYPEEVQFSVKLSGNPSVSCNLKKLSDSTWEGKSDGVTLYGGFIQQEEIEGNRWTASQFEDLWYYARVLQEQEKELSEFNLDLPDMSVAIFTTGNIVRDVEEKVVMMQDHIIVNDINVLAKNYMFSLVPKEQRNEHMYVFEFVPPLASNPYRTAEAARDESANSEDQNLHEFLTILLQKLEVHGEEQIIPALRFYFYHPELQKGQSPVDFIKHLNPEEP